MNIIKRLIGILTYPKSAIRANGSVWVEVAYEELGAVSDRYHFRWNYVEIRQNLFGVWKKTSLFRRTHVMLQDVK